MQQIMLKPMPKGTSLTHSHRSCSRFLPVFLTVCLFSFSLSLPIPVSVCLSVCLSLFLALCLSFPPVCIYFLQTESLRTVGLRAWRSY